MLAAYADEFSGAIGKLTIQMSGISIGVAVALAVESPAMLYKRADIDLYRGKLEGRSRIAA